MTPLVVMLVCWGVVCGFFLGVATGAKLSRAAAEERVRQAQVETLSEVLCTLRGEFQSSQLRDLISRVRRLLMAAETRPRDRCRRFT